MKYYYIILAENSHHNLELKQFCTSLEEARECASSKRKSLVYGSREVKVLKVACEEVLDDDIHDLAELIEGCR